MRTLKHVLLGLLIATSCRVLVDLPMSVSGWLERVWEIALLLALPVVTIGMSRRARGVILFLWLFLAGVMVLGEMLVGIVTPSMPLVVYGALLCALGWYVKVRETSPEKVAA